MAHTFHTISEGKYSELLYKLFGKDRVEKELKEFLELDFFPRVGGGIGMTRIISAIEKMEEVEADKVKYSNSKPFGMIQKGSSILN